MVFVVEKEWSGGFGRFGGLGFCHEEFEVGRLG